MSHASYCKWPIIGMNMVTGMTRMTQWNDLNYWDKQGDWGDWNGELLG